MAWYRQATSHYMSQCWPRSLSPYDITRPQLVNSIPCQTWTSHNRRAGMLAPWLVCNVSGQTSAHTRRGHPGVAATHQDMTPETITQWCNAGWIFCSFFSTKVQWNLCMTWQFSFKTIRKHFIACPWLPWGPRMECLLPAYSLICTHTCHYHISTV